MIGTLLVFIIVSSLFYLSWWWIGKDIPTTKRPPLLGVFSRPAPPEGTITFWRLLLSTRPDRLFVGRTVEEVQATIIAHIQQQRNQIGISFIGIIIQHDYPEISDIDTTKREEAFPIMLTRPARFFFRAWLKQLHGSLTNEQVSFLFLCRLYVVCREPEKRIPLLYTLLHEEEPLLLPELIDLEEEEEEEEEPVEELVVVEEVALPLLYSTPVSPIVVAIATERRNRIQDALDQKDLVYCVMAVHKAFERIFALAADNGERITQNAFIGKEDNQLMRSEWDLLLKRGEGWLYRAKLVHPDEQGNIVLTTNQEQSGQAIDEWLGLTWDTLIQKG